MSRNEQICTEHLNASALVAPTRTCLTLINIILILVSLLSLRTQRGFLMKLKAPGFKDLSDSDKVNLFKDNQSIYSVLLIGHLLCNLLLGSLALGLMVLLFWNLKNNLEVEFQGQAFRCHLENEDSDKLELRCTNNMIHLTLFMLAGYLAFLVFNIILVLKYLPIRKTCAEAVFEFFGKGLHRKAVE